MGRDWYARLVAWLRATEAKLRRVWWLWLLIVFAAELTWHRILGYVNNLLDSQSGRVFTMARTAVSHLPSDPLVVTVILFLVVMGSLAVHAYFDTRHLPVEPKPETVAPLQPVAPAVLPEQAPPPPTRPKLIIDSRMDGDTALLVVENIGDPVKLYGVIFASVGLPAWPREQVFARWERTAESHVHLPPGATRRLIVARRSTTGDSIRWTVPYVLNDKVAQVQSEWFRLYAAIRSYKPIELRIAIMIADTAPPALYDRKVFILREEEAREG